MENYIYQKMDENNINDVLNKCNICILGTSDCKFPYIVPMYFEYEYNNDNYFILESKCSGRKIKNIINNNHVCIFVQYNDNDSYKSIIASGSAVIKELNNQEKSNMVCIKIFIEEIEGRIYYK